MNFRRRHHEPKENVSPQARCARRARDKIFETLGRQCVNCPSTTDLEFDVIKPVGGPKSHHGKMSWSSRMAFYKRQLNATPRNLQILCSKCNGSKRDRGEVQIPLPEISAEELAEYTK